MTSEIAHHLKLDTFRTLNITKCMKCFSWVWRLYLNKLDSILCTSEGNRTLHTVVIGLFRRIQNFESRPIYLNTLFSFQLGLLGFLKWGLHRLSFFTPFIKHKQNLNIFHFVQSYFWDISFNNVFGVSSRLERNNNTYYWSYVFRYAWEIILFLKRF